MAENAMTLFGGSGGNSLVNSEKFQKLLEMTKMMAGGGGGGKRISLRGNKFRMMDGGEQVGVYKGSELEIVIANAAKVSRMYYEGTYDADNPSAPTCWSVDTQAPAPEVTAPQATRCADCPQNIKGSGQGDSRACRFNQRLAILLPGNLSEVYQLQLPAASIFGDAVGGNMPLQAYAKYLAANGAPSSAIVTSMYFDEDSSVPKVFFRAVRPLSEDELEEVLNARESEAAIKAITLTVSQTDNVAAKKPAPEPTKSAAPKPAPKKAETKPTEEVPEEVEEPKKRTAPVVEPTAKGKNIAQLVSDWDNE